jgi:hypothetical protein
MRHGAQNRIVVYNQVHIPHVRMSRACRDTASLSRKAAGQWEGEQARLFRH